MRTITSGLALAAILAFAAPVAAQTPPPPALTGQRVMLVLERGQSVEGVRGREVRGTLVAADSATLSVELRPGDTPVQVPRAAVRQTFVSLGVPDRMQSAGLGAAAGIGTGVAASLTYLENENLSTGENVMAGVIGGALGGALAGVLFPQERWSDASTPVSLSIAPTVTSGSPGLAVTLRF
ncbi:MAG TPA: hypothetical protein VFT45_12245 [Longimicrobium sp.]|nr:hypothetical protein [Longimicrobium sp.]